MGTKCNQLRKVPGTINGTEAHSQDRVLASRGIRIRREFKKVRTFHLEKRGLREGKGKCT